MNHDSPRYRSSHPEEAAALASPPQIAHSEIRGQVGYIAEKFGLSVDAINAIHSLFCEQARRWESKVHVCEDRIRNQREEIKRLANHEKYPAAQPSQVSAEQLARQIFFHVLLKGGDGNPFHGIRNEWFVELAAEKISEILGETGAPNEKGEVLVSFRDPDWCAHKPSSRCAVEQPHEIAKCGEFDHQPEAALAATPPQPQEELYDDRHSAMQDDPEENEFAEAEATPAVVEGQPDPEKWLSDNWQLSIMNATKPLFRRVPITGPNSYHTIGTVLLEFAEAYASSSRAAKTEDLKK